MGLPEPHATNFRSALADYEGRIPWMYLDSAGEVTVGIGHMIPDAVAAAALPFTGGDPASDWTEVKNHEPGYSARWYQDIATCRLPDAAIDALCDADVAERYAAMIARTPEITAWPTPVQQACLDIYYNVGNVTSFPSMLAACRAGDWETAAKESARKPPISEERNAYVRALILSAEVPRENRKG